MKKLKIIFAGTPDFGIPCLEVLFQQHELIAVYTQPDRPKGRGQKLEPSAVKKWAIEHNLPIYQPENFKNPQDIETLQNLKPDLMVVIAYGLILPQKVLDIPKFGCINVHASLLPKYRGASPILQSLLHNDKVSGVSIMQMDKGMDTGAVFLQEEIKISSDDTTFSLTEKLKNLAVKPLITVVNQMAAGNAKAAPQNDALKSYAPKISKHEAHINWDQDAEIIDCAIRAYIPWPVAFSYIDDTLIRIHKAKLYDKNLKDEPGKVLQISKDGIEVATKKGSILIEKVQFPGSKIIAISDLMNTPRIQIFKNAVLQ